MRVLTVVDALRLGGAETLIAQLARVSGETGLDLHVLSLHGESPEHAKLAPLLAEAGVKPHYLGVRRTLDLAALRRLVQYIRRLAPDVVHAHLEMAMTMALPAAKLAGVPAVGTFHNVHRRLAGRAAVRERLALEVATRSAATIFVSAASLQSFADRYRNGRPIPHTWKMVHNGIDVKSFVPAPSGSRPKMPADLGLEGARVVTVLAALRDFKGIRHAVAAWPLVVDRHPDLRLLLVGSGAEEHALRTQAGRLGLGESVVFAGMRSDVKPILQASEVVLLPSLYGENLPTVLMEAGACGRPVVASDVGGIRDIVADGESGILVQPGDSAGIARAVLRLLEDPDMADRMGRAGRVRIERLFDARIWARSLRAVYEDAIAGEAAP